MEVFIFFVWTQGPFPVFLPCSLSLSLSHFPSTLLAHSSSFLSSFLPLCNLIHFLLSLSLLIHFPPSLSLCSFISLPLSLSLLIHFPLSPLIHPCPLSLLTHSFASFSAHSSPPTSLSWIIHPPPSLSLLVHSFPLSLSWFIHSPLSLSWFIHSPLSLSWFIHSPLYLSWFIHSPSISLGSFIPPLSLLVHSFPLYLSWFIHSPLYLSWFIHSPLYLSWFIHFLLSLGSFTPSLSLLAHSFPSFSFGSFTSLSLSQLIHFPFSLSHPSSSYFFPLSWPTQFPFSLSAHSFFHFLPAHFSSFFLSLSFFWTIYLTFSQFISLPPFLSLSLLIILSLSISLHIHFPRSAFVINLCSLVTLIPILSLSHGGALRIRIGVQNKLVSIV
ncbi:unnamed protein product [Acanthosepion pharaonis]|uniref:Uncharacterized protein n=1 Tax=Acanthosepion pharaonis TaxID=158019 RepID=A0A812E560_ACAPH|nr:unnamed protein product [Sepia pharaonis]